LFLSGAISAILLYAAYATHRRHKKGKSRRYFSGLVIGGGFALTLTVFTDALLYRLTGESFYSLLQNGSYIPTAVFLAGALQGVVYEYVGSFSLNLWYYPTVRHKHLLFLLLPLFWAIFMIIMQNTFAIFRAVGLSSSGAFVLTALIPFLLIEGINIYTKTWVYRGMLKAPLILALGWFVLAYTFALGFNKFILNPFGL